MVNPIPPTRAELARFLPTHSAIRAFEELFRVAGQLTPIELERLRELIEEAIIQANSAGAQATTANDKISRLVDILHGTATAPALVPANNDVIDFLATAPRKTQPSNDTLDLLALAPRKPQPINDALDLLSFAPRAPQLSNDALDMLALAPAATPLRRPRYGTFYDTTTQTAAAFNTAYAITFDSTDLSDGVYRGSTTSQIFVDTQGVYNFQFSAQLDKVSGGTGIYNIWPAINGVDVPNSCTRVRIQGNDAETVAAWNFVFNLKAGDYFELKWSVDNTDCQIVAFPAVAPHPAIPSVILTVTDNVSR